MAKKRDESLPVAVATQGGLLAAMAVLMIGTWQGARAWVLLIKAGTAFLLSAALLKLLAAGVMQAIRMKADPEKKKPASLDALDDPTVLAADLAKLEPTEKVTS